MLLSLLLACSGGEPEKVETPAAAAPAVEAAPVAPAVEAAPAVETPAVEAAPAEPCEGEGCADKK